MKVKCPKCATVVDKPATGMPECHNCGFGSKGAAPKNFQTTDQGFQGGAGYGQPIAPDEPNATKAMIFGILGFVVPYCGFIFSILGIVFGNKSKKAIDASKGGYGGRGKAMAGVILGWIAIGLYILTVIIAAVVFTLISGLESSTA